MKHYELEKNTPYYNFYRGLLWHLYDYPHEAMMYFNNALLTEDRDMYYVHKFGASSTSNTAHGTWRAGPSRKPSPSPTTTPTSSPR